MNAADFHCPACRISAMVHPHWRISSACPRRRSCVRYWPALGMASFRSSHRSRCNASAAETCFHGSAPSGRFPRNLSHRVWTGHIGDVWPLQQQIRASFPLPLGLFFLRRRERKTVSPSRQISDCFSFAASDSGFATQTGSACGRRPLEKPQQM